MPPVPADAGPGEAWEDGEPDLLVEEPRETDPVERRITFVLAGVLAVLGLVLTITLAVRASGPPQGALAAQDASTESAPRARVVPVPQLPPAQQPTVQEPVTPQVVAPAPRASSRTAAPTPQRRTPAP